MLTTWHYYIGPNVRKGKFNCTVHSVTFIKPHPLNTVHVLRSHRTWVDSALPVDHTLLRSAKSYLVDVVTRYTDLVGKESDKVGGVMCSIKSRRVTQVINLI